ncbi:MAG TPA: DUF6132 family protein [Bacteroidales bacterium]|nr:DUF6132 family protein [Bacteroidales bacterium]
MKESIKLFFKSWKFWRPFLAIVAGSLLGFLYYYYVGCKSGTCAITSNPYMSMLWGGLMGFFLINSPCSRGQC